MEKAWYDVLAMWLVIIGAINWGLAIWSINLVAYLSLPWLINTVYALVAVSGLYLAYKEVM